MHARGFRRLEHEAPREVAVLLQKAHQAVDEEVVLQRQAGKVDRQIHRRAFRPLSQERDGAPAASEVEVLDEADVLGEDDGLVRRFAVRSEENTSELQSLIRIQYAVFCLQKKKF